MNDQKEQKKPEEIIRTENLIDEGKLDEALTLLNNYEQKEGLSHHDKVFCHLLQCQILFWQGKLKELIKHAEQAYKESEGLENNFLKIDILLVMTHALVRLERLDKVFNIIKQGEELLKSLPQEVPTDYKQREAYLAFLKGCFYIRRNDSDLALKHLEHSLALREELGNKHEIAESLYNLAYTLYYFRSEMDRALKYAERSLALAKESGKKFYVAASLFIMGTLYGFQGELDLSIRCHEQSIVLHKELNNKVMFIAYILTKLSYSYKMRGELDHALECIEQSMDLNRELGRITRLARDHHDLIQILIDKGDLERALLYLHDFEQLNTQLKDKNINLWYLLDKALVLKTSPRALSRGKAEEILKQLLEDEDSDFYLILNVLINLCELLLTELRMTNDLEVLEEINPLIARLLDIAEKSHLYMIQCETYLLKAKLSLLTFDIKKAQQFLTQAQQMAERLGFKLLAIKISHEHDELLKQLEMWDKLKESKAPLAERMELSRLNVQMEVMVKNKVVTLPKLDAEQPVLLSIMSKEGNIILSNPFTADVTIDSKFFSEFLSSCNTFCDQIFSESFDRVKFGQHTVLITTIDSFSICYMFQGQSYSARQKLIHFSEAVKKEPDIMKILEDASNKNIEIKVNQTSSLEESIYESFLSDPEQFQMPFKAYEGDEAFVFVSYSHIDRLQVYPIIDYLNKTGNNIWYDEGIPVSEDWKKSIVNNLERCSAFLVFITPHIIDSEYVRKEISFALKKKKPFFSVYLKDTQLPGELEFEIGNIQFIKKYLIPESQFYIKLNTMLDPVLNK